MEVEEYTFRELLARIVDNRGRTCPTAETGTALIATNCIKDDQLYPVFEKVRWVDSETMETWFRGHPEPGDILFVLKGSPGRCCLVPDPINFCVAQDMVALRADESKVSQKFLFALLRSSIVRNAIDNLHVGTMIPHFKKGDFDQLTFRIPKSRKIQDWIGEQYFILSDKIELNRRMNATLEGMAQALFKSWFVDFDPVIDNALAAGNPIPDDLAPRAELRRQALANGTANREAAKPFPATFQQTESMGWIPEGWEVSQLVENVHLTMGQSPSSDHYNTKGEGLPFHQGVTNYGERFPKHEQYSTGGNRYAEDGDILFSVRAPVGRINIANCHLIIGRGLSALRHKKDYQGFLVYFLKHTFAVEDSIGSGTIFNAVNKKEMERIPLIVPPDEMTKTFDKTANSLDETIASNAEQTGTLTNLRNTLLPKLISGELRIPQADQMIETAP